MTALNFIRRHWGKLLLVIFVLYLYLPIDEIEEAAGLRSGRMAFVLKYGRLAPFPKERTDFKISHRPSWFTDIYFVYFSAPPDVILSWLHQSPGVMEGRTETLPNGSFRYYLKSLGSAGHLDVSADKRQVGIEMGSSWDGLSQHPLVPYHEK